MLQCQEPIAPSANCHLANCHLSSRWIKLIRKLRWIGMAEEAQRLQRAVHTLASDESGNLATDPFDAVHGRPQELARLRTP